MNMDDVDEGEITRIQKMSAETRGISHEEFLTRVRDGRIQPGFQPVEQGPLGEPAPVRPGAVQPQSRPFAFDISPNRFKK